MSKENDLEEIDNICGFLQLILNSHGITVDLIHLELSRKDEQHTTLSIELSEDFFSRYDYE